MRLGLFCSVALTLLGCAVIDPTEEMMSGYKHQRVDVSELATRLKPGNTVEVTSATTKKRYIFRVNKVGPDSFWGTAKNNKEYEIKYAGIETVYARRPKSGADKVGDAVLWFITGTASVSFPLSEGM